MFAPSDLLPALKQQARQHRDEYEQQAMLNAQNAEDQGAGVPWGMTPTAQTRINLGRERAQANFNPQWDAWYQAVSNASGGNPIIGGLRRATGRQ